MAFKTTKTWNGLQQYIGDMNGLIVRITAVMRIQNKLSAMITFRKRTNLFGIDIS